METSTFFNTLKSKQITNVVLVANGRYDKKKEWGKIIPTNLSPKSVSDLETMINYLNIRQSDDVFFVYQESHAPSYQTTAKISELLKTKLQKHNNVRVQFPEALYPNKEQYGKMIADLIEKTIGTNPSINEDLSAMTLFIVGDAIKINSLYNTISKDKETDEISEGDAVVISTKIKREAIFAPVM